MDLTDLTLRMRNSYKIRKQRWLGVACGLLLAGTGVSASRAIAQSSAEAPKAVSDKTVSNKPANPKAHAKAAANASGTTSGASKHKAHPASHPAAGSHAKSNAATAHHPATTKHAKRKKTARGQQKIDSDRAQEIQEALIREHYLSGEANGKWTQASEDAMRRYQADHGWQSKTVPDSRALINLGLGPSHDHLLNPESAMTTGPSPLHAASAKLSTGGANSSPHLIPAPAGPAIAVKPDGDAAQSESSPQ